MKTLGLSVASFGFFAMLVVACGASGNPVSGDDGTGAGAGTATTDSGVATSYGDSGSTTNSDAGGDSIDSGGSTPIDSGATPPPVDAGVSTALCDLSGDTTTYATLAGFLLATSPPACGSGDSCSSGQCCLDFSAALGGGSISGLPGINACVTPLSLSSIGL